MKKRLSFCFMFFVIHANVFANHTEGGEFEYSVLDAVNKIYKIRLILYSSCSSLPMQTQVTVNADFSNGCPTQTYTISAKPQPPFGNYAVEVTSLCDPKPLTTCSSSGSSIKGIQRHLYEQVVQFPPGCGIAKLSFNGCCKNYPLRPSQIMYLEALINTEIDSGNNSVVYLSDPVPFLCSNSTQYYALRGMDADGDSLVYSLTSPMLNIGPYYYPSPLSYLKPFQMAEPIINFNSRTGAMKFTPTNIQISPIAFKVDEYRKQKTKAGKDTMIFVGSKIRDINWTITGPCNPIKIDGILPASVQMAKYVDSIYLTVCTSKPDTARFRFRATAQGLPQNVPLTMSVNFDVNGIEFDYKKAVITSIKDTNTNKDTVIGDISFIASFDVSKNYPINITAEYCINGFPLKSTIGCMVNVNENNPMPKITIETAKDSICSGTLLKYYAKVNSPGPFPSYKWMKNNAVIYEGNRDTISMITNLNDSVWAVYSSKMSCDTGRWAVSSNKLKPPMALSLIPDIKIEINKKTKCLNDTLWIEINAKNEGINPTYKIYKNGNVVAINKNYINAGQFKSGDSIRMELISGLSCANPSGAFSNICALQFPDLLVPSLSVSQLQIKACSGMPQKLQATPVNQGNSAMYYWFYNGLLLDSNYINSYTFFPKENGYYECYMKSLDNCVVNDLVYSNKGNLKIYEFVSVKAKITADDRWLLENDTLLLSAETINAGINPTFIWYKNATPIQNSNSRNIGIGQLKHGDTIFCEVIPDTPCPVTLSAISNSIIVDKHADLIHLNINSIIIMPNPVRDQLTVASGIEMSNPVIITICSLQGETIMNIGRVNLEKGMRINLDLTTLKPGVYILNGQTGNQFFSKKLIKIQ